MLRPSSEDSLFSMDDYVAHQVARILRESREDALRRAQGDMISQMPTGPPVGEKTCAVIKDIATRPSVGWSNAAPG